MRSSFVLTMIAGVWVGLAFSHAQAFGEEGATDMTLLQYTLHIQEQAQHAPVNTQRGVVSSSHAIGAATRAKQNNDVEVREESDKLEDDTEDSAYAYELAGDPPPAEHDAPPPMTLLCYAFSRVLPCTLVPLVILMGVIWRMQAVEDHQDPPRDAPNRGATYMPLLDLLRLIGALHIIAFHKFREGHWCFDYGYLWVPFYFVTSGFMFSMSSSNSNVCGGILFMQNVRRFMFPYSIAVALVIFGPAWAWPHEDGARHWTQTLTMTQAWFPNIDPGQEPFPINAPLWFMSNLAAFWIVSPCWRQWLRKLGPAQLHVCLAFAWLAMAIPEVAWRVVSQKGAIETKSYNLLTFYGSAKTYRILEDVLAFLVYNPLHTWPMYFAGMVWGQIVVTRCCELLSYYRVFVHALLCFVTLRMVPGIGYYPLWVDGFPLFPCVCAILLLCNDLHQWPTGFLAPAKWAGRLAMPIFMFHYVLNQFAGKFNIPGSLSPAAWNGTMSYKELCGFGGLLFGLAVFTVHAQPYFDAFINKSFPSKGSTSRNVKFAFEPRRVL